MKATVETGDQNEESFWVAGRVLEETLASLVAEVLGMQLVVVKRKSRGLMLGARV